MYLISRAAFAAAAALSSVFAAAETTTLLQNGDLSAWEYQKFDGIPETKYETRFDESLGATAVFANGENAASGYIRRVAINAAKTPWLHFRWRADAAGDGFDRRAKDGDDYAMRVYFAARDGLKYKSLSLVRANAARGETWQSPYSKWYNDLRIYVVGDETGEWRTFSVNLSELWRELFGDAPEEFGLVGFMTDGDSAGVKMRARYGDIVLTDSETPPFADLADSAN